MSTEECNHDYVIDYSFTLSSCPAQYNMVCKKCNHVTSIPCSEAHNYERGYEKCSHDWRIYESREIKNSRGTTREISTSFECPRCRIYKTETYRYF